mgnify:CR=1 FL=1
MVLEVFPVAQLDQRGGSSTDFHDLPERVRLSVSPAGGLSLLRHEAVGGMGPRAALAVLRR